MQHKPVRYRLLRLLLPLALFILGCPSPGPDYSPLTLTVVGQAFHLAPGSDGSLLVQVWDNNGRQPAANAQVQVSLSTDNRRGEQLFAGQTDENGLLLANFAVPELEIGGERVLTVAARTEDASTTYAEEVYVGRVYNVLVSTDKPVYQPGQIIHLRGLALDTLALTAAQDQPLTLTVDDPQGNRLMRQELTTSRWGIAAADFVLDSQAPSGDYTITASMGPVTSSRTVEVKPYSLPRFKVDFDPDRTFYLPGDLAQGTVEAHYFFGKPVAGGSVRIAGFVTDVERVQIFELNGETDENGIYTYEFTVPDYFVGQLENNSAEIDLEISVTDTADHEESIDESITIAEQPLLIEAVSESGVLRPGVENLVYMSVTYPDGRTARAELTVTIGEETQTVQTDEFGLATLTITPPDSMDITLDVLASALTEGDPGPSVETSLTLDTAIGDTAVLLRPERAEYRIGETLNLDIYVAGTVSTVYLDVVKGQQTFGLAALPVVDGMAQASIDLDGSLLGTLELHAYVINPRGGIVRDRRFVLVNPAPAQVEVTLDQDLYRPGDTAILNVAASLNGAPMEGALGVAIVDESVFSVGAQDPGFARTYFLLERELSEPRYEIHDFTPLEDDDPSPYDAKRNPIRYSSEPLTAINARNQALFGLFAGELARSSATPSTIPAQDALTLLWGWSTRAALALPLLGFAFYDGTRRRRHMVIALLVLSLGAFFWGACGSSSSAPAASPASAEMAAASPEPPTPDAPRLRQYFPETLFWMPEVETDAEGRARLEVPIADSITTWRVSIVASDAQGNLGSAETGLRVFQEFFVEPDLPRFLTVGDEIAVSVSLFNYLDEAQTIDLRVEAGGWFEFIEDTQELQVEIGPSEVTAIYIPIRVIEFGQQTFTITAIGSALSDAVRREVEILPDGQAQVELVNGQLDGESQAILTMPAETIPGTGRVAVKIYPGVASQIIDGLAGLLQMPYGCFEQTTSVNYPNVMVLDYLKTTDQLSPRVQLRAEELINLGYQRLLTFETSVPGGFSLFGDPPPSPMLTAYGLMQFNDMSRVNYVDPILIERMAGYLLSEQVDDHWISQGYGNSSETADTEATAFVVWALADAGYGDSWEVEQAIAYLQKQVGRFHESLRAMESAAPVATPENEEAKPTAEPSAAQAAAQRAVNALRAETTPGQESAPPVNLYTLALVANALVAADPSDPTAQALLDTLAELAERDGDRAYWSGNSSYMGGYGGIARIETTALMAIALLRSASHLDVAEDALNFLVTQRDVYGSFYTTQSTILALKALILGAERAGEEGTATVTITLNGGRTQTLTVDESNADVVQQIVFDDIAPGEQIVDLSVEGERSLQFQINGSYYLPWSAVETDAPERQQAMHIDVIYDRTELAVNDTVNVTAFVELLVPGTAGTVLVDLGLPPGFSPITADLDNLVEQGQIDRYELTGRQILFYLTDVTTGDMHQFNYRLRAHYPIRAQTPSSQAYDYYTPTRQDISPPQRIQVILGTP
ncbi:MAG: hypothetical protein KF893_09435 [Caldilineaceae bacterium]|nr:hypothetical protein [Caldilineaceae bacterium]